MGCPVLALPSHHAHRAERRRESDPVTAPGRRFLGGGLSGRGLPPRTVHGLVDVTVTPPPVRSRSPRYRSWSSDHGRSRRDRSRSRRDLSRSRRERSLSDEARANFEQLLVSGSKTLEFLGSQAVLALGNLVLSRRDSLLADVRSTVPAEELSLLRHTPLPTSAGIFLPQLA